MKVLKRPVFLLDVAESADYLFMEGGEDVARRWKESLDETIELITRFPEIGRVRHDLPFPGIRTFFLKEFPRYLVFYRLEKGTDPAFQERGCGGVRCIGCGTFSASGQ